jgi:hypothetical protein
VKPKKKKPAKVRKPKNFELNDQEWHQFEVTRNMVYLKPKEDEFLWVKPSTAKLLHAWLTRAIKYLEQKERR